MEQNQIGIYKANSELERYENELAKAIKRKNNILDKLERLKPTTKGMTIKELMVSSSRDTTKDSMLEYVAFKEEVQEELIVLDLAIDYYEKEIINIKKFIEKESKRISKYSEWEQKIITMREAKQKWVKIACSVPYSERQCKSIYYEYKKSENK